MDLQDAGCQARFMIRHRDGKFPDLFDAILADDLVEGEPDDPGQRRGVEQHDRGGDPAAQRRRLVGQDRESAEAKAVEPAAVSAS
jgi:hypothetical protein